MELDLEYFKGEFELAPGAVVHAGASYCQEAVIYQHSGFEPVFWIEALADVALHGARNLSDFPNQKIFCETLYSVDNHQITFNRTSNEAQSSSIFDLKLHKVVHQSVLFESREIHTTITLDGFLKSNYPVGRISLLVLDLQGAELEALKGLTENFHRVDAIFTEVSNYRMYKHQPLFGDVHKYLLSLGFCLVAHDMHGVTFMGDALYVRQKHALDYNLVSVPLPKKTFNLKFLLLRIRFRLVSLGFPDVLIRKIARFIRKYA